MIWSWTGNVEKGWSYRQCVAPHIETIQSWFRESFERMQLSWDLAWGMQRSIERILVRTEPGSEGRGTIGLIGLQPGGDAGYRVRVDGIVSANVADALTFFDWPGDAGMNGFPGSPNTAFQPLMNAIRSPRHMKLEVTDSPHSGYTASSHMQRWERQRPSPWRSR